MPDAIDLLKQDHREVEQLFGAFERDRQPSIAEEICAQLELHTIAEEQFVYPALRERVKSRTTRSRWVARSCRSAADQDDSTSAMISSAADRYASDARRPLGVSATMPARPSLGSAFRRTCPLAASSPTSRLTSGASRPVSRDSSEARP